MEEKKKFYHLNLKLLPVKLHFLALFGSYGGVRAFISLIGKSLNLSATAVGFTITTLMGLTLLSKPLIGSLVDYFRNIKMFLICLVFLTTLSTLCLLLLQPIEEMTEEPVHMRFHLPNSSQIISLPLKFMFNNDCTKGVAANSQLDSYIFQIDNSTETETIDPKVSKTLLYSLQNEDLKNITLIRYNQSNNANDTFTIHLYEKEPDIANFSNLHQFGQLQLKYQLNKHLCNFQNSTSKNEYETYQFWAFAAIVIISGLTSGNANSLSDVACYEILGEKGHHYGHQRVFGTLGLALSSLVSGYLIDLATGDNKIKDYSPGFYVMASLTLADIFILFKIPVAKELEMSTNMYKNIKKVFHSREIVLFATGTVLIGILTASISNYELWYLQDLGASQSLMGWTIVVQCLLGETPFFVVSGWFVKKFGSFNCLISSFAAYTLRFGCYMIIENPWWALPLGTTHGFTFAMFHAAMTHFAASNAPEGLEGTMFGIFGGLIDGLGQASGCLLCGAAYDMFGGRWTFTIASIFSGACAVVFLILYRFFVLSSNITRKVTITP